MTERDRLVYTDGQGATKNSEEKARVAILVYSKNYKDAAVIANAVDAQLTAVLSDFAFFEVVERSNLGALNEEDFLNKLSDDSSPVPDVPQADFLITAKLSGFEASVEEPTGVEALIPGKGGKAVSSSEVSIDFRFYEQSSKKLLFARNIQKKVSGDPTGHDAAIKCAKEFGFAVGAKYAPPARVLEMRGNGRLARISMGTNYGLAKDSLVEFVEFSDVSDVELDAEREASVIGIGTVLEVEDGRAWVEIYKYKRAEVKRGHYVRVRVDQAKRTRDKLFRWNF